ncbi:hypothetical protein [Alphabaculovirus myunipunctae]|uniref:Uncharacterized protein n=1 Tax=Mythimna unipuncta nucleopolyhedrovirus TaxID=447897 RepID=A0A2K9VS38_9ABAC|nr:hypothetical protein [Mythimna unipuncta nucleopolyhedrovirus]AUV65274.1 hypothetical protein [Mythimna unipuncta nucleopolyhedrovirus]
MYNNTRARENRFYAYNYDNIMRQHDAIRNDLRTLKSQVYEVCQQSNADRGLCDRIKSSLDTTTFVTRTNYIPTKNNDIITTTTTSNNDAVIVMDSTKKY